MGSRCLNSSSCRRTDSRTTFLLSFRSLIHHLSFFLSSLAVIKVICLIQDMSQRNSKACDAGLAFDFARTLGPTAADGGWRDADASRSLPRSCFSRPSVTFPFRLCYHDLLASAHLLPEPGGYPDGIAERLKLPAREQLSQLLNVSACCLYQVRFYISAIYSLRARGQLNGSPDHLIHYYYILATAVLISSRAVARRVESSVARSTRASPGSRLTF